MRRVWTNVRENPKGKQWIRRNDMVNGDKLEAEIEKGGCIGQRNLEESNYVNQPLVKTKRYMIKTD